MVGPVSFNNGMQAVPAQQIIDTGRIDIFTDERAYANQTFNVQGQDAFASAVRQVGEQAAAAIAAEAQQPGSQMHGLFQKTVWTGDDREIYEQRLAEEVSTRMDSVAGLHEYRIAQSDATYLQDLGIRYDGDIAGQRAGHLNDLSGDVSAYGQRAMAEGGTARMNTEGAVRNNFAVEFDCEAMAVAEGVALQLAENRLEEMGLFDTDMAGTNNFKQSMDYYVVGGSVMFDGASGPSGHQFVMTPMGNIVEATADPSNGDGLYGVDTYLKTNGNLQSFANGQPLVTEGTGTGRRDVYGPRADDGTVSTRFEQTYATSAGVVIGDKELQGGRDIPVDQPPVEPQQAPAPLADGNGALPEEGFAEVAQEETAPRPDVGAAEPDAVAEFFEVYNGIVQENAGHVPAFDAPVVPQQDAGNPAPAQPAHNPAPSQAEYSLQDPSDQPSIRAQGNTVLDFDATTLETQQMLTQLGFELEGANNGMDGLEGPSTRGAIRQYAQTYQLDVDNMSVAELQDHMVQQIVEQQNVMAEVSRNPGGEGQPVDTADGNSPAKIDPESGDLTVNGQPSTAHFQAAADPALMPEPALQPAAPAPQVQQTFTV